MVSLMKSRTRLSYPVFVVGVFAIGGCVSAPDPAPDQMSRIALQTAPADLQLLCASAAAGSTGVASDKILPVNSRRLDTGDYQIDLNAGGSNKTCIVDAQGNVKSVQ